MLEAGQVQKDSVRAIIKEQLKSGNKKWRELEEETKRRGIPRSTFHYNLNELIRNGEVEKLEDRSYSLTMPPVKEEVVDLCLKLLDSKDIDKQSLGQKLLIKLLRDQNIWDERIKKFYEEGIKEFKEKKVFSQTFQESFKVLCQLDSSFQIYPRLKDFLRTNAETLKSLVEDRNASLEFRRELMRHLVDERLLEDSNEMNWLFSLFENEKYSDLHNDIKKDMVKLYSRHGPEVMERLSKLLDRQEKENTDQYEKRRERARKTLDELIEKM